MDREHKGKLALGGVIVAVVAVAGGIAEVSGYSLKDWIGSPKDEEERSIAQREVATETEEPRLTLPGQPFAPPTNGTSTKAEGGNPPTPSGNADGGANVESGQSAEGQGSGADTREARSTSDPAPEQSVYETVKFPIEIKPVSVTLRRANYQSELPDLVRLEATVTLTVTNKSGRILRLGWLDPYDNLRLDFQLGPKFAGWHDGYHGLPVCTHSPGSCGGDRRSSPLSTSETVSLVATLSGSVAPDEAEKLLRRSKASVVGQLVVVPGGTRPEYAETFSFGNLAVGDR